MGQLRGKGRSPGRTASASCPEQDTGTRRMLREGVSLEVCRGSCHKSMKYFSKSNFPIICPIVNAAVLQNTNLELQRAIREILNVSIIKKWQHFCDHLSPYPTAVWVKFIWVWSPFQFYIALYFIGGLFGVFFEMDGGKCFRNKVKQV